VLKQALAHPLNWILLAALGASAYLTGSWIPLEIAAAAEALWLIVARSHFRKTPAAARVEPGEQALLRTLSEEDRRRFLELDRLRKEIADSVRHHPSVTAEMLGAELPKLDRLVDAFLRMAADAARFESYAAASNLDALEEDVRRQEKIVEKTIDAAAKAVAAQNLDLMQKRLERAAEMRRKVREMRGQLNLVENTIRLLRDQIATMQSPEELTHRLDDLVRSVDAIEATKRETEAITRHLDATLVSR
jgi:hypothetical protein